VQPNRPFARQRIYRFKPNGPRHENK